MSRFQLVSVTGLAIILLGSLIAVLLSRRLVRKGVAFPTNVAGGLAVILIPILLTAGYMVVDLAGQYDGTCYSLWGTTDCPFRDHMGQGIYFAGMLLLPFVVLHVGAVVLIFLVGWVMRYGKRTADK